MKVDKPTLHQSEDRQEQQSLLLWEGEPKAKQYNYIPGFNFIVEDTLAWSHHKEVGFLATESGKEMSCVIVVIAVVDIAVVNIK